MAILIRLLYLVRGQVCPLFMFKQFRKFTIYFVLTGAASVIYHVISPLSQGLDSKIIVRREIFKLNLCLKGLFHRAIAQSGSALCDWAIERSPLIFAREVAQSVGCPTSRNSDLVECLRKIHFSQLLKAQSRGKVSLCSNDK